MRCSSAASIPTRGAAEAIEVSRRAGLPLVIAGIVQDKAYFEREVRPAIDNGEVRYLGPVGGARRAEVLGGARVLLHLINFDEPFGLSVVESLACGTPVIAHARGSMPELIEDGRTGFLTRSLDEAAGAAAKDPADKPARLPRRCGAAVRR